MTKECDHDKIVQMETKFDGLECDDHERRIRTVETKAQRNSIITSVVTVAVQIVVGAIIVAIVRGFFNGH